MQEFNYEYRKKWKEDKKEFPFKILHAKLINYSTAGYVSFINHLIK